MIKNHFFGHLRPKLCIIAILLISYANVASATERLAVIGNLVNIRSGPGTKHEILYQAEKYYPINVIKKSGNWYKFEDFEGDVGWVHKSLVRKISSVITIKSKCNIRSGPDIKYQIVFISEKGVPFKVVERKGKWINIKHSDGHQGWIHKSLIW